MEEEESVCSSYCSSDDYLPEDHPTPATHPDTSDAFARKMKRILLWRAHSEAPAPGTSFHEFSSVALLIPLCRRRLAEAQARRDRRARPGRRYCASPPTFINRLSSLTAHICSPRKAQSARAHTARATAAHPCRPGRTHAPPATRASQRPPPSARTGCAAAARRAASPSSTHSSSELGVWVSLCTPLPHRPRAPPPWVALSRRCAMRYPARLRRCSHSTCRCRAHALLLLRVAPTPISHAPHHTTPHQHQHPIRFTSHSRVLISACALPFIPIFIHRFRLAQTHSSLILIRPCPACASVPPPHTPPCPRSRPRRIDAKYRIVPV